MNFVIKIDVITINAPQGIGLCDEGLRIEVCVLGKGNTTRKGANAQF
jgi:hypothetical protein